MIKVKTNVPIVNMDEQTYKLSDFVEEFKKIELKELKTENKVNNLSKNILIRNKKSISHYSTKNPFCPSCKSRLVSKHSIHSRKLYFYDKGEVKVQMDRYKCDKCGKTFNTDLSSVVESNSNYTLDFIEKVLDLVGIFYGSLRSVAYKVKKDTEIDISIQTIENWILNVEDPNKGKINRYSGYYLFDCEWGKFNGKWCYRFSLFDVKYNTLVADKFYSDEITKNVQEFLEQSTFNKERIAITSDLKEEYKPVIEKLGFITSMV